MQSRVLYLVMPPTCLTSNLSIDNILIEAVMEGRGGLVGTNLAAQQLRLGLCAVCCAAT